MEMTTAAHLCIFVNSFYDVMLANNSEMQRIYGFSMRPDSNYVVGKLHKYISPGNGPSQQEKLTPISVFGYH